MESRIVEIHAPPLHGRLLKPPRFAKVGRGPRLELSIELCQELATFIRHLDRKGSAGAVVLVAPPQHHHGADVHAVRLEDRFVDLDNLMPSIPQQRWGIDATYLATAQHVLELAKHAKVGWNRRTREQQRDLLAELVCNPRLDGRTLRYDLQKPFAVIAKMRAANDWRPQGDSNPR